MKKLLLVLLMAGFVGSMVACNTVHGAGRDIERGGEKMQDAADRNR